MKGIMSVLMMSAFLVILLGTGGNAAEHVLKVGATTAPDGHYVKGLEQFKAKVEEYTGGKVTVNIFPNSQLGNERDLVESVALGSVEMAIVSTGPLPNFVPDFAVFDLPFIISDREKAYNVMDGEIGQEILGLLSPKGIKGLGFWENGFRHITNNNAPIARPEDVRGMKIRTMENPIHMATFKTLGANPTPMAWSEVFTALQQGVIDGQENPLVIIDTAKIYEAQKYVSLTGHFYSPAVVMINKALFESFPAEIQEAILKAEQEARQWERNYSTELDKTTIQTLEEKGVTITDVDVEQWKTATHDVYEMYKEKLNQKYVDALLN